MNCAGERLLLRCSWLLGTAQYFRWLFVPSWQALRASPQTRRGRGCLSMGEGYDAFLPQSSALPVCWQLALDSAPCPKEEEHQLIAGLYGWLQFACKLGKPPAIRCWLKEGANVVSQRANSMGQQQQGSQQRAGSVVTPVSDRGCRRVADLWPRQDRGLSELSCRRVVMEMG